MKSFIYHSPTKIIFGNDAEHKLSEEIEHCGGKRVLMIYSNSANKNGLVDRINLLLAKAGIVCKSCSGVKPNPRLQFARETIQLAISFKADFILAVGGGSVIDTAKAVAHGIANPDKDIWDFWNKRITLQKSIPVGVILTIAAAGSESSASAVLTDEESKQKLGFDSDFNRPRFAILNPELTYTLPSFQVACGVVDIMMHTMDRYFTPTKGNDLTDAIAEALLRTVIKNGPIAVENPKSEHAMSELMWCGSISHNGLTGLGADWDFAPHALSRELGSLFDVAHGAALSTIWSSWARYCYMSNTHRFAQFAATVWGIVDIDEKQASQKAIEKTENFFSSLGMPICFSELGIGIQETDVIKRLAYKCCDSGKRTVGAFRQLEQADLYDIYEMANF